MAKLIDPLAALKEDRKALGSKSASEIAAPRLPDVDTRAVRQQAKGTTSLTPVASVAERAKADFRVFLTLIWRHTLGTDPNAIQLDMAWWLQHGPSRKIIMAFRGFSKSWITGAFALWLLFRNPDEKILVVSASKARAIATTNWCLQLIMTMDLLRDLRPKSDYRQSSQMFDVGNCIPQQSASFMAAGLGGQTTGFRATYIIGDDVEVSTNSQTVIMREKNLENVKEFESIIVPGGSITYLGTPHDLDSLYLSLLRLRNADGTPVYTARIWCALFPTEEQIKAYGDRLAPYITAQLRKHGPSLVGHSTMPNRFTDEDLAKRKAAMGNSEFQLQFMLDLVGLVGAFPLQLKDLIVMDLDDSMGPDEVIWGTTNLQRDLPVMGHDGDFYYGPVEVERRQFVKYQSVIGYVDGSGRGDDETALSVVALLYGRLFWLHLWASRDGYGPDTLEAIAKACIRFRIHELHVESNYGDGMFTSLLAPVLVAAWEKANKGRRPEDHGGTRIVEVQSGRTSKEKRILSVLEPITQQHRLVVSRKVIEWDQASLKEIEGEDSRHRYAWGYQYTHLTKVADSLGHDDRLESLSGACGVFAPQLGVDPLGLAEKARDERYEDELERLMEEDEDAVGRLSGRKNGNRMVAATPARR